MKYPIGIQSFDQIVTGGYVYVDKTDLVYRLVTSGKIYFLSRPRRFGKSLLVSTLKSYFQGRKELFEGLALAQLEKDWIDYPVFHIDFNGVDFTQPDSLENKLDGLLGSWENVYGKTTYWKNIGDRFAYVLHRAHTVHGRRCVVLVDEYDKPLLDVLDKCKGERGRTDTGDGLEERHREMLKGFYSVFKAADEDLHFVLLTGVTKFSQVSVFSGFNQPADISMNSRYEALCGITQDELERYFAGPIHELAQSYGCSDDEMRERLKFRYDGYHFGRSMVDVYNPFSLLNAFDMQELQDYWFASGTPSYLLRLLSQGKENLNELTGRYYPPQSFIDYKSVSERALPMLYQSGYLTIKAYNPDMGSYLLDFPNNEVKNGFVSLVASDYLHPQEDMDSWVTESVAALRNGDTERFRRLLTSFLAEVPYTMRRKADERERERYFHYTFYLIFRLISSYTIYTEKQQSEGRVDCIVETPQYVYIFEFKLDGSAGEALQQIEEKGYARPYEADKRKLCKIGVSFSSQTGTVEDWAVMA